VNAFSPSIRYTLAIGHNVAGFPHWSRETVESTVSANWTLPGFTLTSAFGRWEGVDEDSTLVTYLGDASDEAAILAIAERIAADLQQDAVLVTAEPVRVAFVSALRADRAEPAA
jgi:hypothetical protein